jgi:hypothetical protein
MEDYVIKRTGGGSNLCAKKTSAKRTAGGIEKRHMLAFKSRSKLIEYVKANEALGFTFG